MFNFPLAMFSSNQSSTLYWVGGSASWDGTAGSKWATTSGGAGGHAVPTATDNVVIDANSGAVTVTMATVVGNCANLDFTGFTGTFAGSTGLNVFGSLTLATGMTMSYNSSAFKMKSNILGKTITFHGKGINSLGIIFDGVGGGWTFQDAMTNAGALTLTNGSLNTNNKAVTVSFFNSNNSNTRSLTLGSSAISSSGGWGITPSTGMSFSAGTSVITITGNATFTGGGLTYNEVDFTASTTNTAAPKIVDSNTFATLKRTNTGGYVILILGANQTVTSSLVLTGGNATDQRLLVKSDDFASPRTITSNGSNSLTNVDFNAIAGAGSASWTGTSVGDALLNSGITFTTPVTRYLVCPTGAQDFMTSNIWATSSGGTNTASKPLPHDTIIIDGNSFLAASSNLNNTYRSPGMDFTNAINSPTLTVSSGLNGGFYGNLKLIAAMSLSGSIGMIGYGLSLTLKTAGLTCDGLTVNAGAGSLTLLDALTSTFGITHSNGGTFDDGGFNVQATVLNSTGTSTRTITKSGNWTLTGTGALWNVTSTGLTINDTAGTITFNNNSSSSKTFAGAGFTYHNFYNNTLGTGVLNITGSNTFADFKSDQNRTNQFTATTTTTVATITATGASSNLITFGSITGGNYNIVSNSGTAINTNWISISHCQFSGATWHAGANSTNGGNNAGITFP